MTVRQILIPLCLALFAAAAAANAAEPPADKPEDADALALADEAKPEKRSTRDWRAFGEGSFSRTSLRGDGPAVNGRRLSLDLRYDGAIAPGLRAILSDRLDVSRSSEAARETNVNTLREAYLSWHASPSLITDIGRVNIRYGAALGYNPTDFFKPGALRSIVSPDPASLRENRQGTFALQGQKLWTGSSLTGIFSPHLGGATSDSTFALDFDKTNPRNRWLLAGSHKLSEDFNPQVLLFGGAGMSTQAGLNLSALVNAATVAFLEVSAGRGESLVAKALANAEPEQIHRRAALGLTYTTAFNLSLTAELEHNSAAPNRRQWDSFSGGATGNVLKLLEVSQAQQDLPVRQAMFIYAAWRDIGVRNLDLSAFIRRDSETRSRDQWIETRYRWDGAEVALQWQLYSGGPTSLYGSVPQARRVEAVLRLFL